MSDTEPAGNRKKPRILYIDNIRILLICLVIATHAAITYGGPGPWYFIDPGNGPQMPYLLTAIDMLCMAFFMGFFTLISAYFIVPSLVRKGRDTFIRDRLVRLGIPLIIWILVLAPLLSLILAAALGNFPSSLAEFYVAQFVPYHGLHIGPMWFVAFLLIATGVYLLWAHFRPPAAPGTVHPRPFPSFSTIVCFGLLLGVVTAIVRIFLPMGTTWILGFQPPFFAQYIALFMIGIYASEHRWLDAIPDRVGRACTLAALLLIAAHTFFIIAMISSPEGLAVIAGGPRLIPILYAFWDQMTGAMLIPALLWIFSRWFNDQGPVTGAMAADSYTVYIIHPLVLVSISVACVGILLPQEIKFTLVLLLTIAAAFALGHLIRALPGAKRVL